MARRLWNLLSGNLGIVISVFCFCGRRGGTSIAKVQERMYIGGNTTRGQLLDPGLFQFGVMETYT